MSVCQFVTLSLCLFVKFKFIELLTQLKMHLARQRLEHFGLKRISILLFACLQLFRFLVPLTISTSLDYLLIYLLFPRKYICNFKIFKIIEVRNQEIPWKYLRERKRDDSVQFTQIYVRVILVLSPRNLSLSAWKCMLRVAFKKCMCPLLFSVDDIGL